MRVLIYGVNSSNKGAQLLLAATAERLLSWGHTPVVSARDVTPLTRRESHALGMFSVERFGSFRSLGLDWLPNGLADRLPVVGDRHFDYVLDASGFSLTDSWGMAPVASRITRLRRWRARGVGLTMLPQAFGPFKRDDVAQGVAQVLGFAEAVWARDAVSADHVKSVGINVTGVAPDITVGLAVRASTAAAGRVVIVPNWNLAERNGPEGRLAYTDSLADIARTLKANGRGVVLMSHEGARDLAIAQAVAASVSDVEVMAPDSGLDCKRIIAGSELVIAGRFHALVSALSTGVPAIGHSWSHKYAALMDDFGVSDGLADPLNSRETLSRLETVDAASERPRLALMHDQVQQRVDVVWSKLESTLTNR